MREELNSIDPLKLKELDKTMALFTDKEAGLPEGDPPWLIDGKINEARFAGSYLANHPMKCVKEVLYGMDGIIDEKELENDIYKAIKAYTVKDVAKLVKNLISVLKIEAYSPELPLDLGHIHFSNGTYCLEDESFTEKKVFCRNRLPRSAPYRGCLHSAGISGILHDPDQQGTGHDVHPWKRRRGKESHSARA